jgi:hypothetical protein
MMLAQAQVQVQEQMAQQVSPPEGPGASCYRNFCSVQFCLSVRLTRPLQNIF